MKFLPKLLVAALLFVCVNLTAQSFQSAVGARFGFPLSASYKMFVNDSDALEFYVGYRSLSSSNIVRLAGAYQRHTSFELSGDFAPLQWYYGGGASVAFSNCDSDFIGDDCGASIGISGYLGLQYAFEGTPVELTLDWIPTINIGNSLLNGFGANSGSLGVRYILNR